VCFLFGAQTAWTYMKGGHVRKFAFYLSIAGQMFTACQQVRFAPPPLPSPTVINCQLSPGSDGHRIFILDSDRSHLSS
jgi:hypothetical protein